MFEWSPIPDRFRYLGWLVAALLVVVVVWLGVVVPYRAHRYMKAHPEFYGPWPDCSKAPRSLTSPDGRYDVYNGNPCTYAKYGTVVQVNPRSEPESYGFGEDSNTVLNIRSGGPIFVTWKSSTELLIDCTHCRETDAWFVKRRFRDVSIQYRFDTR